MYALTSDEEWVIAIQPEDLRSPEPTYHFAIARRGIILLQSTFRVPAGSSVEQMVENVSRERMTGVLHDTFHVLARAQGVRLRKTKHCRGRCPFLCAPTQLADSVAACQRKVPQELRERGYRVFLGWETPILSP